MTATQEDRSTWTSDVRAIVRCARKGCRRAYRADFATTVIQWAHDGRMAERRTVSMNGREGYYRDRYDLARFVCRDFTCVGCGGTSSSFDVVRGSFSESVKCRGKCRGAVGPSCECQCGGENHGSGHTSF